MDTIYRNDSIKIVLIIGSPQKIKRDEYISFYRKLLRSNTNHKQIERLFNAVNQIVLRIAGFNKMVIHADSGDIISLFLNISLACDYRIIGDDTVFQNPNIELEVMPKGGGVFFLLRILGPSKTFEILLSNQDIDAEKAANLGIVDKIVPLDEIEDAALKIAQNFAENPAYLLTGIKKLINFCEKDLTDYLYYENEMLREIITSPAFHEQLEKIQDS